MLITKIKNVIHKNLCCRSINNTNNNINNYINNINKIYYKYFYC